MGDDGFGLAALERLRSAWEFDDNVQLVDGGTWGLNLVPILESADAAIILDAIDTGGPAGRLVLLSGDDVPRRLSLKLSPHQVDLREILAVLALRGTTPKTLIAIGVTPESVELRDGLTPAVAARLDEVLALTIDQLDALGVRARELAPT